MPQRLPAGASVCLLFFIRSASAQVSPVHGRATGVNTHTDTPSYHYYRRKCDGCKDDKMGFDADMGNYKQSHNPLQAESPSACIVCVYIVIRVASNFSFKLVMWREKIHISGGWPHEETGLLGFTLILVNQTKSMAGLYLLSVHRKYSKRLPPSTYLTNCCSSPFWKVLLSLNWCHEMCRQIQI